MLPYWLSLGIGYAGGCYGAHLVVATAVRKLWSIAEKDLQDRKDVPPLSIRPHRTLSFWHGFCERAVYVTSIVLGKPEGIAVWLAFKAVMRWKGQAEDVRS